MTLKPKIAFFLIIVVSSLLLVSCKKNRNDVIPDVYVNFYMDLNDPEFFDLLAVGGADTISYYTNNYGLDAAGYDYNGIIVYRALLDQFYAFDRTCPHDFKVNNKSIKVRIDGIYAVCPECGTQYALPSGGTPSSGVGRYPLKNYKTAFDGQFIHVWHY